MFAKLVSATWGEETGAEVEDQTQADVDTGKSADTGPKSVSDTREQGVFSLWGVASSLAESVKKNTAEITTGLKETNWRAELEAFGKGVQEEEHQLRKETVKRVEVAKEHLPKDATAQLDMKRKELAAHLQKMGVGLGGLGKTLVTRTTDLFDQVRDTVVEELSASDKAKTKMRRQGSRPLGKGKYSRLEADISSMQRDSATYCDEPADTADYQAWRSNFDLAAYKPAVDELIADNAFMAELQARIVPVIVEYEAFWTRYFYRLHLLETRHAQRLEVAQRATRPQQEEELGWDDTEDQGIPHAQQPSSPAPPDTSPHESPALSEEQPQTTAAKPEAADHDPAAAAPEAEAAAAAMPSVPEEHVITVDNGGSEQHHEKPNQAASTAGDESAAETVTSSESGSGTEHWTVVKSPSQKGAARGAGAFASNAAADTTEAPTQSSTPQPKTATSPPAAVRPKSDASKAAASHDDDSEIDELDDVSNDGEVDTSGGPGSERDEDWGEWE